MDAGKLLGLTNCCGIAVGVMGNLLTGAVLVDAPLQCCVDKLVTSARRRHAENGLRTCKSDSASRLLWQGCWQGAARRGSAGCGA